MKCGFCGLVFDPVEADQACTGCPLTPGCHLVRCPRCGYEMPPEAKLTGWLRRVHHRVREHLAGGGVQQSSEDVTSSGDSRGSVGGEQ